MRYLKITPISLAGYCGGFAAFYLSASESHAATIAYNLGFATLLFSCQEKARRYNSWGQSKRSVITFNERQTIWWLIIILGLLLWERMAALAYVTALAVGLVTASRDDGDSEWICADDYSWVHFLDTELERKDQWKTMDASELSRLRDRFLAAKENLATWDNEHETALEELIDRAGITTTKLDREISQEMGSDLFSIPVTAKRAMTPVGFLSGGERNRVLLARLFTQPSNLLVLVEPTNDLDVETLEVLEAQLAEYGGTLIVVSHDRAFLDNVVTSTLAFEDSGRVVAYPGGYSDWQRKGHHQATRDRHAGDRASQQTGAAPAGPAPSAPTKLSYKLQRALDERMGSDLFSNLRGFGRGVLDCGSATKMILTPFIGR